MEDQCSAIEAAVSVFGRAWAGAVLRAMTNGAERFRDIRRVVPGVTDAVLATRLKELCARGFAERVVEPGPPVAVRYTLTDLGRATEPVLEALERFGHEHADALLRRG